MAERFRVALSGDFRNPDGSPSYPAFDLSPLSATPGVETAFLESASPLRSEQLADFDALILLSHRFDRSSIHPNGRRRRRSVRRRLRQGRCRSVHRSRHRARDHAGRGAPTGCGRGHDADAGAHGQAPDQGTADAGGRGYAKRGEHMGIGLVGRTLGSIGFGNIGAELFRLAKPLDMRFIAHDPFADRKLAADLGVELVELDEVFRRADIVTVNCPLTPETRHLVNAERLLLMKPTAYLINTARGPIVDQRALAKVLVERRIAGAGLDVLEEEPPRPDDPVLTFDNVILAPHALCWTDQCFAGNGAADVRAVLEVQQGRVPRGVVNRKVLDDRRFLGRLDRTLPRFSTK